MERDSANLFVLEGVLIALILLGAAYTVRSLQEPSIQEVRPRTELGRLTHDVLVVLEGLDDGNGTSVLDHYLAEQYHCTTMPSPSPLDCDVRRAKNLSIKIDNYLPLGAGWAIQLGNGVGAKELFRSPLPRGESVSSSLAFAPEWNLTFVATEFSCYEPLVDINATLVPIDRGAAPSTRWGNVTIGETEIEGIQAQTPSWWNVTLDGATRPASGTIVANVTGDATLRGSTAYGSCVLGGASDALREALLETPFAASPSVVPIGSKTTFAADLSALESAAAASITPMSITSASVTVYEPLPPRNGTPDSFIVVGHAALSGAGVWAGAWEVPPHTLYGTHPALLRVGMDVDGVQVELRRVATIDIALPTGEVPIDAPYRAVLQTWLADWG